MTKISELSRGTLVEAARRAALQEKGLNYRTFRMRVMRGNDLSAIQLVREVEEERQAKRQAIAEEVKKINKTKKGAV